MRTHWLSGVLVVLGLGAGGIACAQDSPAQERALHHHHHQQGTPPPGKPRCIPHTDERAGYPRELGGHLEPSTTSGGIGYYVGGGVPVGHGQLRHRDEGTWGWDETGCHLFRRRTILGWSGGRKYQGGAGAYATDGPHIPDVIYGTTSTLNSLGRRD
ncbi:MAG: hypothetical protein ACHRXM_12335 [Isosphaerales bacterium]